MADPIEQLDDNFDTLNKYKTSGVIATRIVTYIVKKAKVNTKLIDLLNKGNELIIDSFKPIEECCGICFPLCLSVNNIVGHNIPKTDVSLKEGDILKIELGIHIDGFPAIIAYSTIINSTKDKIDDKRANVMNACIKASKDIIKTMTPTHTNLDVAKIMQKYADKYQCSLPLSNEKGVMPGVFSCQMSRFIIDGNNADNDEFIHQFILSRENPNYEFSMQEIKFEENEVYAIDIVMSTGNGRFQSTDCNIYKRNHDKKVMLKMKASREALNLFNKQIFPICVNTTAPGTRLGLKECYEKELLEKYPVFVDKENEYVARIKFTVIVGDNPILICGKSADGEFNKIKNMD